MKRTYVLIIALFVFALAMSACSFTVGDTTYTIVGSAPAEPEVEPAITPTPAPTAVPSPEDEAQLWQPGGEFHYLLLNADYAEYAAQVINACGYNSDGSGNAEWVIVNPPGIEGGVKFTCLDYLDWATDGLYSNMVEMEAESDDNATPEPTVEPTQAPTATPVVELTAAAEVEVKETPVVTDTTTVSNTVVLLDGMVTLTGFPAEAETVRWGYDLGRDENDCGVPELAWLICNPGVISFDKFDEEDVEDKIQDNPSAVWSGGANVDMEMTTMIEQFLNPGNGYMKANWAGGWIRYGEVQLYMEPTENVSFMFVSRGVYAEEGGGQTPTEFEVTDEDYRGAAKIMRYPIEDPNASGFYSWTHFNEDVEHQLTGDNCDYNGCGLVVIIATDVNRGNVTVSTYTAADGYTTIYTNSRTQ